MRASHVGSANSAVPANISDTTQRYLIEFRCQTECGPEDREYRAILNDAEKAKLEDVLQRFLDQGIIRPSNREIDRLQAWCLIRPLGGRFKTFESLKVELAEYAEYERIEDLDAGEEEDE
jgi:hypothetical protein